MWEQIALARADYCAHRHVASGDDARAAAAPCKLSIDGPGGSHGWRMRYQLGGDAKQGAKDQPLVTFQIRPLSTKTMPQLSESYVRGEDLILNYVQQESDSFGLSLQVTPVECTDRTTVVQLTISLQTDLLDSHPSIELVANVAGSNTDAPESPAVIGPRLLWAEGDDKIFGTVVLDPRDQQAAIDCSDDESVRIQLFGNFLEKGVIRKSRPWIVFWHGSPPGRSENQAVYQRLCETPLPLTT